MSNDPPDFEALNAAKENHEDDLLDKPGVVSVGVGINSIIVGTNDKPDALAAQGVDLPNTLDGVPVSYDPIGDITPELPDTLGAKPGIETFATRTEQTSPIPGGVSIGHPEISAGTSGFVLKAGNARVQSSNNHVLANSNNAYPGDDILQPGSLHNGDPAGTLSGWQTVEDGATVDLAWADIDDDIGLSNEIVGVEGPYGDIHEPKPGDELVASGITTGVTSGIVRQVSATVKVNFGEDVGTIRFKDQVITSSLSQPGDSGSPVLYNGHPAGMVFAGSDSVSVIMTAANIEAESGMIIETTDQPAATVEDAMWTFQARPDPYSRYDEGVYDGDTYHLVIDQGFRDMTAESVRAMHLDTAEIQHAKSEEEREMAYKQRDFAREWMREAAEYHDGAWPLLLRTEQAEGKYGRWIGAVYNRREESLAGAIIDEFGEDYLQDKYTAEDVQQRFDDLAEDL